MSSSGHTADQGQVVSCKSYPLRGPWPGFKLVVGFGYSSIFMTTTDDFETKKAKVFLHLMNNISRFVT